MYLCFLCLGLTEHILALKYKLANRIFKDDNLFATINKMTPDLTRTCDERLQTPAYKDCRPVGMHV